MIAKPTVEELGIDPDAQEWQRSGDGAGAIEIAFACVKSVVPGSREMFRTSGGPDGHGAAEPGDGNWILMRVADDPERRVLVFDRNEWECFLDGARKGEFDDATGNTVS